MSYKNRHAETLRKKTFANSKKKGPKDFCRQRGNHQQAGRTGGPLLPAAPANNKRQKSALHLPIFVNELRKEKKIADTLYRAAIMLAISLQARPRRLFLFALSVIVCWYRSESLVLNPAFAKRAAALALSGVLFLPSFVQALEETKMRNADVSTLIKIVAEDVSKRQALATADFTRAIYSETANFIDEIDTYPIDKYVSGTKALFNAEQSHVELIGDVTYKEPNIVFRFSETLAFNVPFTPKVTLSGRVELTRDNSDEGGGLIIQSREFWDDTPLNVLKTVKF